mmetsp:Transcript_11098/g.23223  ORF Transcript_11098/g.23223 Transcript_11098/m.23223 type:complete len:262 (+) Transcript_11098:1328-2113(+)
MALQPEMICSEPRSQPTRQPVRLQSLEAVPIVSTSTLAPRSRSSLAISCAIFLCPPLAQHWPSYASSENTTHPASLIDATSWTISTSLCESTRPVGLCGVFRTIIFVFLRSNWARRRSFDIEKPSSIRKRTSFASPPASFATGAYHGKKGSNKMTSSPGEIRVWKATLIASVPLEVTTTFFFASRSFMFHNREYKLVMLAMRVPRPTRGEYWFSLLCSSLVITSAASSLAFRLPSKSGYPCVKFTTDGCSAASSRAFHSST